MSDKTREQFNEWLAVRESGKGYPADLFEAWQASRPAALAEGADYVLDLLVAAGHITREKAFHARDIARSVGVLPPASTDEPDGGSASVGGGQGS
jgi:hypothetical protein